MFSTCMFCNRPLGANQVIEHFPVGRRLAFDAERGRLWVVCRKCERWNLSPLEERWEAVEMCERLFRDARVRVSTENVGLARHREGLELVRIGQPMRPEFAAWRYGDQFGRRRKRALLYTVGGVVVLGGIAAVPVASVVSPALYPLWKLWSEGIRAPTKVRTDDGRVIKFSHASLLSTRLLPADDDHGFRLEVGKYKPFGWRNLHDVLRGSVKKEWFEGTEAERLLGQIIPKMNRRGGRKRTVQAAVSEIEHHGSGHAFLADVVRKAGDRFWGEPLGSSDKAAGYIYKMPTPTMLALEMALHEEQERRALEGELWRLERAWEEAEEIAAISDSLLLPTGTEDFIEKHHG